MQLTQIQSPESHIWVSQVLPREIPECILADVVPKQTKRNYQIQGYLWNVLKVLFSFWPYGITDNKYPTHTYIPGGLWLNQQLRESSLQCLRSVNASNAWQCSPIASANEVLQTISKKIVSILSMPPSYNQDPCEGSSLYFCCRMAVVLSRAQPGRMMPNFPGIDKSTTVEPRRHSGLWPSPIGPPSMTRDK